jgi:hypothetical protein
MPALVESDHSEMPRKHQRDEIKDVRLGRQSVQVAPAVLLQQPNHDSESRDRVCESNDQSLYDLPFSKVRTIRAFVSETRSLTATQTSTPR